MEIPTNSRQLRSIGCPYFLRIMHKLSAISEIRDIRGGDWLTSRGIVERSTGISMTHECLERLGYWGASGKHAQLDNCDINLNQKDDAKKYFSEE